MTDDAKTKKYLKEAIAELDKAHERRYKVRDQKADQRMEASLKRHIGALTEDFDDKLSGVAEMMGTLMTDMTEVKENIVKLKSDMSEVKDTLDVIQSDVEIIKNDLKQKVDRSEFEALVKRVSFVEKKLTTK